MSSVLKPVGPEDAPVYWKRRALVGGIIVLALLILFLIFRPKGESPETATAASSQSPVPTSPAPSASPSGSASESASGSPSPSGSTGTMCQDASMAVELSTSQPSYAAGENPQITMAIINNGDVACDRDVGSLANSIDISSGGVRVWSSDDCSTDSKPDVVALDPGQRATVTVDWPRTESEPGCKGEQAEVSPGFYDAVGKNGKVASKKTSFSLQ